MIKKYAIRILSTLLFLYLGGCTFLYFAQEKFYFNPKTLDPSYRYQFDVPFEEINIKVAPKEHLNSLLFTTTKKATKGVILYLHGNAGALHEWGLRSKLYTNTGYDILFVDYRGYGKNKNTIENETMLHNDLQHVYNYLKTRYTEDKITVLGFSIGSGLAARIAAKNNPKQLILEAPYYSFESLVKDITPFVPKFLIRYKIPTNDYIKNIQCPITIFHGQDDFLIKPEHSERLQKIKPERIQVYYINNCNHNGIYLSSQYHRLLNVVLR